MNDPDSNHQNNDLNEYQVRREHLQHEHKQLLERLRQQPTGSNEDIWQQRLLARFKDLQALVDMQALKIAEMLALEKAHRKLSLQYEILESTNQKLINQLMLFSDAEDHRRELETLVDQQQRELRKLRTRLREAHAEIDALRTRLLHMKDTNAVLSDHMEDHRIRLERMLEREAQSDKRQQKLQTELQQAHKAHEALQNEFRTLKAEYERIFNKR